MKGVEAMSAVEYINMFVEYFMILINTLKEFFAKMKGDDAAAE